MIIRRIIDGKITDEELTSPIDLTADVVVAGAGSAGIYAASAAAREGVSVILIENDSEIGGTHVRGLVTGYYYGFSGGSFEEDDYKENPTDRYKMLYKLEHKAMMERARISKCGVNLLTSHTPTGVIMEDGSVRGLSVFNGEREIYIEAKMVIDSTGDGFVIRMTGAQYRVGREIDGKTAPFSIFASCLKDDKVVMLNRDSGTVNHYDAFEYSRKVMLARKKSASILSEGELIHTAPLVGIREGICFLGEEKLCVEDVLFEKVPPRVLFYAYSDLDRHGSDKALDEEVIQSFWVISNLSTVTVRIPVPMGAVVPKGIGGIVSAGRCFSADSHSQGAVRMTRDMCRMGECVGVGVAMAVKSGVSFTDVDYGMYLEKVTALGTFAGDVDKKFGFHFPRFGSPYTPVEFDFIKNREMLKTETPGVAIWSAYVSLDRVLTRNILINDMNSATDNLQRYNAAIALGLIGDKEALPVLREIVENRDAFYFKDCRRTNQLRSAIAVCLIGRIGDESDVPRLRSILFDKGEFDREMYHTLEPNVLYSKDPKRNFVYFSMITHTAMALLKIYSRTGLNKEELASELLKLRDDGITVARTAPGALPDDNSYKECYDFMTLMIDKLSET